ASTGPDTGRGAEDEPSRTVLARAYERLRTPGAGAASADMPAALRGLSLFAVGNYESFDKHTTPLEPGFDRNTAGITLGADYSFGNNAVLGLALNYNQAKGSFDIGGGGFEIDTYGFLLYGGLQPIKNLFVDGYAGYARKDYA